MLPPALPEAKMGSLCMVRKINFVCGSTCFSFRPASRPFNGGIAMSVMTTSGRIAFAASNKAMPSVAVPEAFRKLLEPHFDIAGRQPA